MPTLHIAHYKHFAIRSVDPTRLSPSLFAQLILQEINPKGWCAVPTLHIAHYKTIAFAIRSVDPTRLSPTRLSPQRLSTQLILHIATRLSPSLSTQLILQEINPKGWCAVPTLHDRYKTIATRLSPSLSTRLILQEINPKGWWAVPTLHIATRLSPSLSTQLILQEINPKGWWAVPTLHIAHYKLPLATSHCFLGGGRRQFFGVRPRSRVQAEKPYPA